MSGALLPVAVYGLEVPAGDLLVPAAIDFPATIRFTMAAIDPTAPPQADSEGNIPAVPRSTLKIVKRRTDGDDDDEDDFDHEYFEKLLGQGEEEDSESEEEAGPSDPAKSKKARREAAIKQLLAATEEESDDEMEDADSKPKSKKGKSKATEEDDEESDEGDDDEEDDLEEFVVCTLDTERNYQQPVELVVGEGEEVFFLVTGTHSIHLTGNYVIPANEESEDEDEDEEYDSDSDEYGLNEDDSDDMSDELDGIDGAERIKEIDTDEEEAPKLVDTKKKNKKRAAEEEAEGLDELVAKDEKKLSKKQAKKLKNNQGEPVAADAKTKESPAAKGDKKVQFAKNLEQGPTGPAKDKVEKTDKADKSDKKAAAPTVKVVNGVTIDDRKVGTGRTVKSGDKVGMRYIGKLQNGKVFDSNKKGQPFSFKIGKGEVIKGWDIGIAGMAVGGERRLTIPPHLAYGSRAIPGIPANSTLIFDVKLIEIK